MPLSPRPLLTSPSFFRGATSPGKMHQPRPGHARNTVPSSNTQRMGEEGRRRGLQAIKMGDS